MLFLKILGVLLLLFLLLCLLWLGVRVSWGQTLYLAVVLGPVRIPLLPKKDKSPERMRKKAKCSEKTAKRERRRTPLPKPGWEDIREGIRILLPAGKRALRRFGRGIRVAPLRLSLTLGGREDPADAAGKYGYLQAAIWSLLPQLQRLVYLPDPKIHTDVDYEAERTDFSGEAAVTLRVGTLLLAGLVLLIPAIRWFLTYQANAKKHSAGTKTPQAA